MKADIPPWLKDIALSAHFIQHKIPKFQHNLSQQCVWEHDRLKMSNRKAFPLSMRLKKIGLDTFDHFYDAFGNVIGYRNALALKLPPHLIDDWIKFTARLRKVHIGGIVGKNDINFANLPKYTDKIVPFRLLTQGESVSYDLKEYKKLKYWLVKQTHHKPNNFQQKMMDLGKFDEKKYKVAYKHIYQITDTKTRSFFYQHLLGLNYANSDYHRFGHRNDANCSYCSCTKQDKIHLYFQCPKILKVAEELTNKLCIPPFTLAELATGSTYNARNNIILQYLVCVRNSNIADSPIDVNKVWNHLLYREAIEQKISENNNKMFKHLKKWNQVLAVKYS